MYTWIPLESAPCPPYFVDNIYDIFIEVAINQSLTVDQYTTIAKNCNIFPKSTTTSTTVSPTKTTVDSTETTSATESSTTVTETPITFLTTSRPGPTTVEPSSTSATARHLTTSALVTHSLTDKTTETPDSSTSSSISISTETKVSRQTTVSPETTVSLPYSTSATKTATKTTSSSLKTSESSTTKKSSSAATTSSVSVPYSASVTPTSAANTTPLPTVTATAVSPRTQPLYYPVNSCNGACKIAVGCTASIFIVLFILAFVCLKLSKRKHRRVRYKIHGFDNTFPTVRLYDHVMQDDYFNKRSLALWKSDSGPVFYKGYSRSFSDLSVVNNSKPHIYLPADTSPHSENGRYSRNYWRPSNSLEERYSDRPKLRQCASLEDSILTNNPLRNSNYRKNGGFINKKCNKVWYTNNRRMGNPYSLEEYESESSFDSSGPAVYDGPITFTPEVDRRPLPRMSLELRRELIEQTRDSRKDKVHQSRHRSRSHDSNLVPRGYLECQFSFDLDPDCPDYRPAGRYKKHNPREKKMSRTPSREFNVENMNRYAAEIDAENNFVSYNGHSSYEDWHKNSLRNRNKEQKVISSILKNNRPPNIRSQSDCSGDGLRETQGNADVFVYNRNRSQSQSAMSIGNKNTTQKPNTIYFYQTKL